MTTATETEVEKKPFERGNYNENALKVHNEWVLPDNSNSDRGTVVQVYTYNDSKKKVRVKRYHKKNDKIDVNQDTVNFYSSRGLKEINNIFDEIITERLLG